MKGAKLACAVTLVFLAAGIFAAVKAKESTIMIEKHGVKSTLAVKNGSLISFRKDSNKLSLLTLADDVVSDQEAVILTKGTTGKDSAALTEINLEGSSFVIERNNAGAVSVRIGDIESLSSLQEATELKKASVTVQAASEKLSLSFSETPQSVRYFALTNPDRVVIDLLGLKGSVAKADGVRSANHPAGCRIVVERKISDFFAINGSKNSFAIATEEERRFAEFKETKNSEKKVAAAEKQPVMQTVKTEQVPAVSPRTEIDGIMFVGENPQIMKITAAEPLKYEKKTTGEGIEVTVKNSFVGKDKEQLIDASSLNGPVKEIAIYNEGNDVKIVAKTAIKNAEFEISAVDNGAELTFAKPAAPKTEQVAGFSDTASKAAGAVMTQAADSAESMAVNVEPGKNIYRGKKISLDFKDVDILDVLRLMSEISKLNIIAGDDVKGTVTVRLINIPWDEALDVILKSKSLGKERMGSIIRVAALSTIQREKEAELARIKADQKLEPVKVRLIAVNYAMAAKLMPQTKELLSERGSVNTDDRTNVLIVKDVEENLDKIEQLVEYLDTQTPQVLIEAKIVEATSQAAMGLGIEWGTHGFADAAHGNPTGAMFPYNMGIGGAVSVPGPADRTAGIGFSFGSVGNVADLNLTLNVMESDGKIKIVSSPKVATLDNTEAMIQQGVSIPITTRSTGGEVTTKYVDATLILKSTPHITADGSILMKFSINKSEPDWSNANYLGEPAIIKKEAQTDILVKSGDTVVIGGVYTNKVSKVTRGIPFLSDIPILGWLFKSVDERVERSELLIFLTPRIMNKVKSSMPLLKSEEE